MSYLKLILFIALYYISIFFIGKFLLEKTKYDVYKANCLIGIFSILISIVLIFFSDINFKQAGFKIGNIKNGLVMVAISFLIILISIYSMKKMTYSDLLKIPYINFGKNKLLLLYMWALVGPVEEIFYRGFIQGSLEQLITGSFLTIRYSTLISMLIFILAHLSNVFFGKENLKQFLNLLPGRIIMSFILCYTFQISQSLLYPIIIHNFTDGITISYLLRLRKKHINEYQS
ncbi:MAG TPA: CPBP family intramembrane metalloprotease [Defluviitoga sp.]|nr:CPBP family intramembrane metalloprotease [Defluviitoga sp.]HOP24089.1 CPBP family intramembrane metalloprotease [Defluviitoga sp.]HPZ28577.1 CPBP family intramembrane metalloprotease [Defluviitoga sp.]HQD62385.1 CPBP family intramembrane metalloprotease [Defluviitoga sp.]